MKMENETETRIITASSQPACLSAKGISALCLFGDAKSKYPLPFPVALLDSEPVCRL